MFAKEPGTPSFDLPEEVLEVLPSDPFEQLDVARKITSIALSARVSALESEASALRSKLADKDALVADLHDQIESLDHALSDAADKLFLAEQEKVWIFFLKCVGFCWLVCLTRWFGSLLQENLLKENASLSNTVKKLNRDVSKVVFFVFTVHDNYKFSILGNFFLLNIKNLDSMNCSAVRKQSKIDGMFRDSNSWFYII